MEQWKWGMAAKDYPYAEIIRLIQTFSVAKQTTQNIMKWAGNSYYNSQ